jgi:hypothetical protein
MSPLNQFLVLNIEFLVTDAVPWISWVSGCDHRGSSKRGEGAFIGGAWHPAMMLSSNRRRQRCELRPHPKEEAMSHALATVLHGGRKAASNIMAACLASSREA